MGHIRATDYHDIVRVDEPHVSPDGERVAFVRKTAEDDESDTATVHVAAIDRSDGRRFTASEGVDSSPRWSPSGDRIAFVSTRGDNDDRPQLWVIPTDGGEARQVTDVAGAVSGVRWSPDGTRIVFSQATTPTDRDEGNDLGLDDPDAYEFEPPDPRVVDRMIYRADAAYKDGRRGHVYTVDLETDKVTRLTDGEFDHFQPAWGDDDTVYYGVKRRGDPEPDASILVDVLEHDLDTGTETLVAETSATLFLLDATPDGRVAYTTVPEEYATLEQIDVEVVDTTDDTVTRPTDSFDRTVDAHAEYMEWGGDGTHVYFAAPDEGRVLLWRVPGDATGDPERVSTSGHLSSASAGTDTVAYVASEWDHPGDVFSADANGNDVQRVTTVNADLLADRDVGEPEDLHFESEDGVELQGWLLTPPNFDPDDEYPLAVEIHGGPHAMWSTSGTMWHEFQTLAARGYVVFWCNPRGSSGYGQEFTAAIRNGGWGSMAAGDILAGVDLVADREYVDDENVFVTGGSYGGYMTAWLVGHTDRFRGAVTQRGVYELNSFYGSTDAFKLVEWEFDTTPWTDPDYLWEQSPIAAVDQVDTPTLVVHADNDFRVPINNAELLYLGLKQHGVDTRFVRYPREGHELSRSGEPGHIVDRIERIARWFDGYSSHHDAPPALERGDDGLSGGQADETTDD